MASAFMLWNWIKKAKRPDGEWVDDFADCSRASLHELIQTARIKAKWNQTIKDASDYNGC